MRMTVKGGKLLDIIGGAKGVVDDELVFQFKEGRVITQCKGVENASMFANLLPSSAIVEYNCEEEMEIGLKINRVKSFIQSRTDDITLDYDAPPLEISNEYSSARLGVIDPDAVSTTLYNVPDPHYNVTFNTKISKLTSFVSRAEDVVGADTVIVEAHEHGLYMYGEYDTGDMEVFWDWDEVQAGTKSDYEMETDWSETAGEREGMRIPSEEHASGARFSSGFLQEFKNLEEMAEVSISNQGPIRFRYDHGQGAMSTYLLAPRFDSSGGVNAVPDSVVEQYE